MLLLAPSVASATPWTQAPSQFFNDPPPGRWSTKIELADLNNDGFVDILFANVGGLQAGTPDSILANQVFINENGMHFTDMALEIFGEDMNNPGTPSIDAARVIKAYDFDSDGDLDILLGTTWQTRSRYYENLGNLMFVENTDVAIPDVKASFGDAEVGDVDGDGDLDVILTDWGPAPVGNANSPGGLTRVWLNDGLGVFTEDPSKMPAINVNWSWEIELLDIDNDWDLDLAISCRSCPTGGYLFTNDGEGAYSNATPGNLPQKPGSVDFEIMDIDGDGYVDMVTLQDGDSGRNRILINNKKGGFTDQTATYWPPLQNTATYDFMAAFVDANSDRKPDIILGAFGDFKDRLMTMTNGSYVGTIEPAGPLITDGTYAVAVGDLDNDTKIDLVFAEGENSFRNRVFKAQDVLADTAKPVISNYDFAPENMWEIGQSIAIHARVHDNKSPSKDHDWTEVVFEYAVNDDDIDTMATEVPMGWYGEYLWRTDFEVPAAKKMKYRICAEDAAHNRECTPTSETDIIDPNATDSNTESNSNTNTNTDSNTDSNTESNTNSNTNTDSNTDSNTESNSATMSATATESDSNTVTDSNSATLTDSNSNSNSATESDSVSASNSDSLTNSDSNTNTESESDTTATGGYMLDDDGCGCSAQEPSQGLLSALGLLGLLGLRRRRR
ncbi:MAG: FG-GAP-like repeat-containing protein [Nannocystaceae bacterium]